MMISKGNDTPYIEIFFRFWAMNNRAKFNGGAGYELEAHTEIILL